MDERYYTPELSEFHIGFEFEILNTRNGVYFEQKPLNEWVKVVLDASEMFHPIILTRLINDKFVRVKSLDYNDIAAEGWRGESRGCFSFKNGTIEKSLEETNEMGVYKICGLYDFEDYGFEIEIKNRSELKFLMKRLRFT